MSWLRVLLPLAAAIRREVNERVDNVDAAFAQLEQELQVQAQLQAGHVLRDRFVLEEYMGSTPGYEPARDRDGEGLADMPPPPSGYTPPGARAHTPGPGIPAEQFPDSGKLHSYSHVSHLGKGSFGDTWKAYDRHLRKYVAIKIFYMRHSSVGRNAFFLTPAIVQKLGEKVAGNVKEAVEECVAVKHLMTSRTAASYPGSHNMCQCFQEHVSDAQPSEPIFLVLELCGKSLSQRLRERPNWAWRKQIITQILQGVDFLQANGKIHHDLKPDNVCVTDEDVVKIIDLGGLQNFGKLSHGCAYTPAYSPPEVKSGCYDLRGPVYAYDGYATGLMLMEFMCGSLTGIRRGSSNPCSYSIQYGSEDVNARYVAKMLTQVTTTSRMSPKHAVEYLLSPLPTTATTTPSTTATTTPSTTPTTTHLHYDAVYTHQRRRMAVDGYNPHLYAQKTPAPPPPHRRPYDPNRYTPPPTTARPLQYDAVYDYRFDHNRYTSTTADWREKYNLHRMARDSPEPVPSTTGRHRTLEELRAMLGRRGQNAGHY